MFSGTIGCIAALGSAAAWAFCSILFRKVGEDVSPAGIMLANSGIGIIYLGIALLLAGIGPVDTRTVLTLGLSGLLGLSLGGILFFRALMCLGPKLTVIMGLSCPIMTIALAVVLLHERPSPETWLGAGLTLAGITLVLWKRSSSGPRKERMFPGLVYAALSALCTAVSMILAKVGVADISPLQAAFIRQLWAVLGLALWGCATSRIKDWLAPFREPRLVKLVVFGSFVAMFGGFWLSMMSLKYVDVSVSTTLCMTEPLFILPFTALLLKEQITWRETAGALIAFSGVALIFLR